MQTIEEINLAITEQECIIADAQKAIRALRIELISATEKVCGIEIGDRVKIKKDSKVDDGIFGGFRVRLSYKPEPIVFKLKKDGTASKFEFYTYGAKIEKA